MLQHWAPKKKKCVREKTIHKKANLECVTRVEVEGEGGSCRVGECVWRFI